MAYFHAFIAAAGVVLCLSSAAIAQSDTANSSGDSRLTRVYHASTIGWGPHMGMTVNPDQFHVGLHMHLGTQGTGVHMEPTFDLGFGDGVTVVSVNFQIIHRFPPGQDLWSPFLGGGLGTNFNQFDTRRPDPSRPDGLGSNFETRLGVNLAFGLERNLGGESISLEGRIGLLEAPEFKLTAGWTIFR